MSGATSNTSSSPKTAVAVGLPLGIFAVLIGLLSLPSTLLGMILGVSFVLLGLLLVPSAIGVAGLHTWGKLVGMVTFCGLSILLLIVSFLRGIPGIFDVSLVATLFGCGLYLLLSPDFEKESGDRDVVRYNRIDR